MRIYLIVMLPINGLMLFLLVGNTFVWMKVSAAVVLLMSLLGFVKGYVRRLVLTERGPRLVRLFHSIEIPWSKIQDMGRYIPGGGVGATEYVYLTTRRSIPEGIWDIDQDTIQIQNQTGLLEAIRQAHLDATQGRRPLLASDEASC